MSGGVISSSALEILRILYSEIFCFGLAQDTARKSNRAFALSPIPFPYQTDLCSRWSQLNRLLKSFSFMIQMTRSKTYYRIQKSDLKHAAKNGADVFPSSCNRLQSHSSRCRRLRELQLPRLYAIEDCHQSKTIHRAKL